MDAEFEVAEQYYIATGLGWSDMFKSQLSRREASRTVFFECVHLNIVLQGCTVIVQPAGIPAQLSWTCHCR